MSSSVFHALSFRGTWSCTAADFQQLKLPTYTLNRAAGKKPMSYVHLFSLYKSEVGSKGKFFGIGNG